MNTFDEVLKEQIAKGLRWAAEGLERDLRPIGTVHGVPVLVDMQDVPLIRQDETEEELVAWFKSLWVATPVDPQPDPEPETEPDPLRYAVREFVNDVDQAGLIWPKVRWDAFRRMKEAL